MMVKHAKGIGLSAHAEVDGQQGANKKWRWIFFSLLLNQLSHYINNSSLNTNLVAMTTAARRVPPSDKPSPPRHRSLLPPTQRPSSPFLKTPQTKDINASVASLGRSRGGASTSGRRGGGQDFQIYMDWMMKDINERRQRLQQCIKLFNLMQSQGGQLRCLQHSNVQTIYCVSERRVLCINCVYGATRHRTHKLVPLRDAATLLEEDNMLLRKMIDSDLKGMDDSMKNCQYNSHTLQRQMKKQLERLESEFSRKLDELKARFAVEQDKVKKVYMGMIEKSKNMQKCTEEIKFKTWQTLSKIGIGKRVEGANVDADVGRQVLSVNMSEVTHIQIRVVTEREIQRINHKLTRKQ